MANDPEPISSRSNILIVAAVITAVLLSLIFSMLDNLQSRTEALSLTNLTTPEAAVTIVLAPTSLPSPTPIQVTAITSVPAVESTPTVQSLRPACGGVPESWVPYSVRPGDTLLALGLDSGATVDEIIQANCLELNTLVSGITIYLPDQPPVRELCGPAADWVQYTVQSDDTLYSLARSRATTVYAVMQANCLSSSNLVAGRQLYLPPLTVVVTKTATAAPLPPPTLTLPTLAPTERPLPTATWTSTVQAVPTIAATPTASMTPTPTAAPVNTTTPSPTVSSTETATPSPSPAATNTATSTATASSSATVIATETSTPVPTATATALPSQTPTATPEDTSTPTPTATSPPDAP